MGTCSRLPRIVSQGRRGPGRPRTSAGSIHPHSSCPDPGPSSLKVWRLQEYLVNLRRAWLSDQYWLQSIGPIGKWRGHIPMKATSLRFIMLVIMVDLWQRPEKHILYSNVGEAIATCPKRKTAQTLLLLSLHVFSVLLFEKREEF